MLILYKKIGRLEVVIEKHRSTFNKFWAFERHAPLEISLDFGRYSFMASWDKK